ncbi:hypothetical protein [Candidatus Viridilinea mediisalina]|uniref:Uncharacterized protein n=1 Tax=Candidatus Viridilinea mediisalina TaxID=2024553 RepID=A0A2A6RKJ1_9CHLR|nr:hypothetical protein [Candidatus Viridilinea mediisalina]PDW03415.1 hypothetical protein CJ255_08785 [Candidatus Viridilinea mediisalina]
MLLRKPNLYGATVEATGCILDAEGQATGWWVSDDGRTLVDIHHRVVGTITLRGRVYDQRGQFMADVVRYDYILRQNELG